MRQPSLATCLHVVGILFTIIGVAQCTSSPSNNTKCWTGTAGFITDFTLPWQLQADRSRLQTTEDKLYFIYGAGAPVVAPSIWRSNIDGTKKEIFACRSGCAKQLPQLLFPKLLVVDPVGGYVYWWDTQAYYIARAKMNGTGAPEMLVCAQFGVCQRQVAGLDSVTSIVVDSQKTNRIYWTSQNMIASAPLTGNGPVTKIVCDATDCAAKMAVASPHTLRIDTTTVGNGAPFLYWLSFRLVMRVRVDGTDLTGLACHVTVAELPNCKYIRNDVFDPKLLTMDFGGSPPSAYWADAASNRMFRLNMDLSSLTIVACQDGAGCGKVPPGGYNDVSFLHVGIGSVLHWIDSGPISGIDMSAGRLITADADGSNAKTLLCGPAAGCYPPTPRYARWQSTGAVTADIAPPLGQGSAGMGPLMGITVATSDSSVTHIDLTVPLTTPQGFKDALVEPAFSGTGQIDGLVVRPSEMGGGLVWTVAGRVVGMGDTACGMDGSLTKTPPTQLVCAVGCATASPQNVGNPSDVTFDVVGNGESYMYWTDSLRRTVMRSNAQGTNITVLACRSDDPTCTRKVENLQAPSDIQIDRVSGYGQYLFIMDRNPFSRIIRVDITGNESPVVLTCPQHCGVGGCGGCLYPSEHVSIIQELRLDVRGGKTNSPPMLYWIDRGLDRVMRMPGDATGAPTPVACASDCGNGLDIGYGFIVDSHDFVIDWESTPARAYFVKEAYPPQITRINLPQRNGSPAPNGPEPIALVCGSANSNAACRQRVNGDIVPFGMSLVSADGQTWLYYGALRGTDRGPPTVIMRQLVRSSTGASVTGTPEVVVCSKYKYCKNVVPQLYGLSSIVARQNAVSKKWELWWGNAYSPETAYAEQGEYGIFRSNLDGTNATMLSRGTNLIPGFCQSCMPGRDALCTSPASNAFCAQNCTAGINDPISCPASKCSCSGEWQKCRPCQVGVDAGCTQNGTPKKFCQEQCAAGGRRYGGKCAPAVCMCEEGYGSV